jgi:hypothetical protein
MTTPSINDIALLISEGEMYTRPNESFGRNEQDKLWPYWFDYHGLVIHNFHSIEHLIMFFQGAWEESMKARLNCKIEQLKKNDEGEEDEWIVTQEGMSTTLYIAYGADACQAIDTKFTDITDYTKLEFATKAEREAYIQGIEDGDGWDKCIYERADDTIPPQSSEEVDETELSIAHEVSLILCDLYDFMNMANPKNHADILKHCVSYVWEKYKDDVTRRTVGEALLEISLESAG